MDVPDLSDELSSVIPGILYLSGFNPSNKLEILNDYMIRRILRFGDVEDFTNTYDYFEGFEYLNIIIRDSSKSHFTKYLIDQCIDFIDNAGGPVLVHCYAGISRSATVVIAYLMWKRKIVMREARLFVKSKRESISPNSTFISDLMEFSKVHCIHQANPIH